MKVLFSNLLIPLLVSCQLTKNHTVIGVYTQTYDSYKAPTDDYRRKTAVTHDKSFIASSYVKFI